MCTVTEVAVSPPSSAERAAVQRRTVRALIAGQIAGSAALGASVTVGAGVSIGRNTVVGAGSLVLRDLPDHVLAAGSPARIIRTLPPEDGAR